MLGLAGIIISAAAAGNQVQNNNRNVDKTLKAQSDENQKTREYNLQLAEKQNQWNREQWNLENAYNSPTAQLQRLKEAGLNPDLVYGGGISNTSTSSPQMTSGAPATPMDWSALAGKKSIGDSVQQSLQNQLTKAQIDNINADTEKKGGETSLLADEKQFRAAILQGEIEERNIRIKLHGATIDEKVQNVAESQMRVQEMQQCVSESVARIEQMHKNYDLDKLRYALEKARTDAQVSDYASQCRLRSSQKKQIDDLLEKMLTSYDDAHEAHIENVGILRAERGIIEFDKRTHTSNEWDEEIGWYANVCKYIDKFTDSLDGLLSPAAQIATRSRGSGGITINNNM